MAIHLPVFSKTQQKHSHFRGYKKTLSTLLKTKQLKKKFIKYSNANLEQLNFSPQKSLHKLYNLQSKHNSNKWKNDITSQKSQEFNRYSDYQSMMASSLSKNFIRESQSKKNRRYFKQKIILHNLKKKDSTQNLMISTSRQQQSPKQAQINKGYFVSGNLQAKMNEYLNILLKKSDQQYQQKLHRLQEQAEVNRIKREKRNYASQNHYYKVMKASDLKKKRRSESPSQKNASIAILLKVSNQKDRHQAAIKQHIDAKSQLFRRTEKIVSKGGHNNSNKNFNPQLRENVNIIDSARQVNHSNSYSLNIK